MARLAVASIAACLILAGLYASAAAHVRRGVAAQCDMYGAFSVQGVTYDCARIKGRG